MNARLMKNRVFRRSKTDDDKFAEKRFGFKPSEVLFILPNKYSNVVIRKKCFYMIS